ncbi:MAG: pantoate--beta-alanine ligase [Planctomycetota bacterium]|nr:pantoate--beta-alanine ligase [Planctomycetota bacterium]
MKVIETISAMRADVQSARAAGKTIGLVPTMGALHAGHVSLIDAARAACDYVIVTIFVNPTQFAPTEDLGAYPRTPEADLAACRGHGADAVFMPGVAEMYPPGALTDVRVRALGERLCGRDRPVHFGGVCTVVAKLFNIVPADKAFFGQKDFQQTVVIKRMAADLNFPVEVVVCPTVREADGLAMSSRNAYLTPAQRRQAPAVYGALQVGREMISRSHPPAREVIEAMRGRLAAQAPEGQIDYVAVVNPDTLDDVETTGGPVAIALAVRLGRARLIDNIVISSQ